MNNFKANIGKYYFFKKKSLKVYMFAPRCSAEEKWGMMKRRDLHSKNSLLHNSTQLIILKQDGERANWGWGCRKCFRYNEKRGMEHNTNNYSTKTAESTPNPYIFVRRKHICLNKMHKFTQKWGTIWYKSTNAPSYPRQSWQADEHMTRTDSRP